MSALSQYAPCTYTGLVTSECCLTNHRVRPTIRRSYLLRFVIWLLLAFSFMKLTEGLPNVQGMGPDVAGSCAKPGADASRATTRLSRMCLSGNGIDRIA